MLQVSCQKLRTRNVTRCVSKIKDSECYKTRVKSKGPGMLQDSCKKLRTRNVTRLVSKVKDPECLRVITESALLYGE